MKPSRTPVMALLAFLPLLLLGLPPLGAQSADPEEPEIVLPEVILRIEDFSVEEVEAVLPEDEELLPRERQIPLPAAGELEIGQPASPLEIGEAREAPEGRPVSILSAQAILGAGTMNHVYSLISLNRVGQEPRFRLRFLNETLDGMSGEPTGSGFDFRQYSLDGEIRIPLGGWTLLGQGLLEEEERGMQRQIPAPGGYASRIAHTAAGDVGLEMPFGEHFTLRTGFGAEYTASLLTGPIDGGPAPSSLGEVLLSPSLEGTFRIGPVWLGLDARYAYRATSSGGGALHRVGLGALIGVEFLEVYRAEAQGGWLYSSAAGHLPPFSVSFSGSPWPVFSFQVSGGYRVDEPSYADVLALFPFAGLPALLVDNHGWFVDGGVNLGVGRSFGLNARVRADWSSALPQVDWDPAGPLDAAGLLTLTQEEGVGIESEVGLRWNIGSVLTLGAGLVGEFGQRSVFDPLLRLRIELEASAPAETWGGRASLEMGWGYAANVPVSTIPLLDLSAFYRISEAIVLSVEIDDVLYPLIGGPRSPQPPFAVEGLRGSAFVEINL